MGGGAGRTRGLLAASVPRSPPARTPLPRPVSLPAPADTAYRKEHGSREGRKPWPWFGLKKWAQRHGSCRRGRKGLSGPFQGLMHPEHRVREEGREGGVGRGWQVSRDLTDSRLGGARCPSQPQQMRRGVALPWRFPLSRSLGPGPGPFPRLAKPMAFDPLMPFSKMVPRCRNRVSGVVSLKSCSIICSLGLEGTPRGSDGSRVHNSFLWLPDLGLGSWR